MQEQKNKAEVKNENVAAIDIQKLYTQVPQPPSQPGIQNYNYVGYNLYLGMPQVPQYGYHHSNFMNGYQMGGFPQMNNNNYGSQDLSKTDIKSLYGQTTSSSNKEYNNGFNSLTIPSI